MLISPLEQFTLIVLHHHFLTITTETLALLFIGFRLFLFFHWISNKTISLLPESQGFFIETIYLFLSELMERIVKAPKYQYYFVIIFNLFFFIFFCNLLGLIPYTYSLTSQFIITSMLSTSLMIGITILGIQIHKDNFFSLFIPNGISIFLAPVLVVIEIISYLFRAISLSTRLFANMMAGHTLLKISSTFIWLALCSGSAYVCMSGLLGCCLLILLIFLEFGVALIQSYVFTILICIYFNDVINLH